MIDISLFNNLLSVSRLFSIFAFSAASVIQLYMVFVWFFLYMIGIHRAGSNRTVFTVIKGFYFDKLRYINRRENDSVKAHYFKTKDIRNIFIVFGLISLFIMGVSYVTLRLTT